MIFHTTVLNSRGDANPFVSLVNWCYISLAKVVSTDTGVPSLITKTVQFQMVFCIVLGSFTKLSERKAERGKLWCIYKYILCIQYTYIHKLSAHRIQSIKSGTHLKTNHRNRLLWRMNGTLLLDGKDANGKLLLDFHGSESLIFFVQLYPTATKRPYSSSKIVSEKGFTMVFPIEFSSFWQSPPLLVDILKTRN